MELCFSENVAQFPSWEKENKHKFSHKIPWLMIELQEASG